MEDTPRYRRDLIWNLGGTLVLGLSGIALNLAVGAVHGSAALGVFNQALTCLLIASQVSVAGLYFSTLHFCGLDLARATRSGAGLPSALLLGCLQATMVTFVLYFLADPISQLLDSPPTRMAILAILPGLWCLTLNKILLAAFNGYRYMRLFAVLNSTRYLTMVAALGWLLWKQVPAESLTFCLSLGEMFLLPVLLLTAYRHGLLLLGAPRDWWSRHLRFGSRSALAGLLLDMNTRVDLMILGYFCSDQVVGVFSCAALFAEGFYHILIAVQSNTTPLLSVWAPENREAAFKDASRQIFRTITPWLVLLWLVSVPIYAPLIRTATGSEQLASGWTIYALMGLGFVLISQWFPLFFALNQWGYTGGFTLHLSLTFITNIALNLALAPSYGAHGAALATMTSWCLSVLFLKLILRRSASLRV